MKKLLTAIASTAFLTLSAAVPSMAEVVDVPIDDLGMVLLSNESSYGDASLGLDTELNEYTSVTLGGCTADLMCVQNQIGAWGLVECSGAATAGGNMSLQAGAQCVIDKGGFEAYNSCTTGTCPLK
ncbi:MAG: hypothetical protein F6K22_13950 [Okeania sp. SIO2F4]|uniref:hypothetical protein n=1 Tax=Okeania sp. SIO2F4 TaxID=2607790 RepID=UPI00142C8028|nr:hypothetical protein [Okeania sp. SIO2F4]NES03844.1 hypothetical protein [Okeania sp. SIO2F4]